MMLLAAYTKTVSGHTWI